MESRVAVTQSKSLSTELWGLSDTYRVTVRLGPKRLQVSRDTLQVCRCQE